MLANFECHCVFVEFTNDRVPNAGRIEYCAQQCDDCRSLAVMSERGAISMAANAPAPRHQRLH